MLSSTKLQVVCDFFNLGTLTTFTYLGAQSAHNYFVTTALGTYVFRVIYQTYNATDPRTDLETEIRYTTHINLHQETVPTYITNPDGEYIYSDDKTYVVVRPKIEGVLFHAAANTPAAYHSLGEALGHLHTIPVNDDLPIRPNWPFSDWLAWALQKIAAEYTIADPIVITHPALSIEWSGFPQSCVHGDCRTSNILVRKNESITLFDWEEVSTNAAITDLSRFIVNTIEQSLLTAERYQALLTGYESIRALSTAEKAALPTAVEYMGLVASLWRMIRFHDPDVPYTADMTLWHQYKLADWQPPEKSYDGLP